MKSSSSSNEADSVTGALALQLSNKVSFRSPFPVPRAPKFGEKNPSAIVWQKLVTQTTTFTSVTKSEALLSEERVTLVILWSSR
jgi:hypothetical protein